jgi:hypothetical protein
MKTISDDVFASWKDNKKKFVVAESFLHDSPGHLIILSDYSFWAHHIGELQNWCEQNNCKVEGMTVVCETDQDLTAFILKWS